VGTVAIDGQPVGSGTIAFEPADGKAAVVGGEIHDGKYRIPREAGMQAGKKLARITAVYKTGRQVEVGMPAPPGTMVDEVKTMHPPPTPCEVTPEPEKRLDFNLPAQ
jgi:hypothetical protein